MNSADRTEFEALVATLCAGFNVPVADRPSAYWTGLANMTVTEFARCVEHALGEDGPAKIPTAHEFWAIRKSLRARKQTAAAPATPTWQGDAWDIRANRLLFAHITRHMAGNGACYGPNFSAQQAACTEVLVSYKRAWAQDMRDEACNHPNGHVDPNFQRDNWRACMQLAEQQVSQVLTWKLGINPK